MEPSYEEFCNELRKKAPHTIEIKKRSYSGDERLALVILYAQFTDSGKDLPTYIKEKGSERGFPEKRHPKRPVLDDFGLPTGKEVEETEKCD